jgi:hypothetical protein
MIPRHKIGVVLLIAFSIFFFVIALYEDRGGQQWTDLAIGVMCLGIAVVNFRKWRAADKFALKSETRR